MATYRASVDWTLKDGDDFANGRYSRGHSVVFEGGHETPGTASPHVVGARWAVEGAVDPEQMLVAAINTCHLLSYLHAARLAGFTVTRYRDEAEGTMTKNDAGEMWVSRVSLRPRITFEGPQPTPEQRARMHETAHHMCFIANSVKTEIVVEEVLS